MKKTFITIMIALFGLVALPTGAVSANGVDGGVSEPGKPSQSAYDATLDKAYTEGQQFWQECVFLGHDADACEYQEQHYADAMWDWLATEYAYATGENVVRYAKPVRASFMPASNPQAEGDTPNC